MPAGVDPGSWSELSDIIECRRACAAVISRAGGPFLVVVELALVGVDGSEDVGGESVGSGTDRSHSSVSALPLEAERR